MKSLKASDDCLKIDPSNWKALLNRATMNTQLATLMGGGEEASKKAIETHKASLEDLKKALEQDGCNKSEIERVQNLVHLSVSEVTMDKDEALEHLNEAIKIIEEPTTLFMRFKINMAR